jgi:enamine deaminase RidA (YjgF/YER057c/UK114 family)
MLTIAGQARAVTRGVSFWTISSPLEAGEIGLDTRDQPGIVAIHYEDWDGSGRSPYVPAIRAGSLVFISGVTAAPVYHDHPHRPEVFDSIPRDIEGQVPLLFANLDLALVAAGCARRQIVVLNRFFTDVAADQDFTNGVQARWFAGHTPTSTSVEVRRLATDPRLRLEISAIAIAS